MRGTLRMAVVLCALAASGCATSGQARYVYQDGQFGVVGIPENTSVWPTYYRVQADLLMQKHFPEGFEVVRAEEVEEGSRTLTVNGTSSAQLDTEGPVPLLKVGKFGHTGSKTQADSIKIKECRIVYKKAGCTAAEPEFGFAKLANQSPEPYLDPNAEARKHLVAKPAADTAKLAETAAKDGEKAHQATMTAPAETTKSEPIRKTGGPARE
jgi:hypothetical protein